MENKKDSIDKIESISTVIVNIGTLISWGLTIFTAFVLTSQPQPISLPGFIELNAPYKLLLITSVFFGYIQLLRRQWGIQKRKAKDVEGSFGSYLFGSIIKFKRPLILIGFLIIFTIAGTIIFTEMIGLGITIVLLGISTVVTFFVVGGWEETKRKFDDEFRKKWIKRVRNQLYESGCTHTLDFTNLPVRSSEINWAIEMYFDMYEFVQDLIFTQRHIEKGISTYRLCEIRFKHVPSRLNELDFS